MIDANILIPTLSLIIAFVSFTVAWKNNTKKEQAEETNIMVSLKADLKFISRSVEKIEKDISEISDKLGNTNTKLTEHEEKIKTLFSAVKEIKEKIGD